MVSILPLCSFLRHAKGHASTKIMPPPTVNKHHFLYQVFQQSLKTTQQMEREIESD